MLMCYLFLFDIFPKILYSGMVANFSKASHCRASDCWCRSRISIRYRVVFLVAFFSVQCLSSLLSGSCGDGFEFIGILRGLLLLYRSPLVLTCKICASVIRKQFLEVLNFIRNSSTPKHCHYPSENLFLLFGLQFAT